MLDVEPVIRAELERLSPAERVEPDWAGALARGSAAHPRRTNRRATVLLAAAVVLGALVPAVALSAHVRGLLGFPGPRPVLAESQLLVSAPVGNGFFAHSWVSPSSTGGRCAFTTADHDPMPEHATPGGGSGCSIHGGTPVVSTSAELPLSLGFSISRRLEHGDPVRWVPPVVSGLLFPQLRAVRVEVRWRGGSHRLTLHDDAFIGGGPFLYMPQFREFPFTVVAYDAAGREVARKRLDSPSLLLLRHGWKEYARSYHAWQRAQRR